MIKQHNIISIFYINIKENRVLIALISLIMIKETNQSNRPKLPYKMGIFHTLILY